MTITRVYLGNPAGTFGMQPIAAIRVGATLGSLGMTPGFSRGTISQTLIGGGTTTQRLPELKSSYSIDWSILKPADFDLLMSFFDGGQGGGPYCLVDPSQSNFLPPNVSRMGAVTSSFPEWVATVGALATSTSAGPTGLLSGVCAWTGAATSSVLWMGLNNVIDGTWLPPIISGKSHRVGIWAKVASGSATLTAAVPYGVAGSAPIGNATATAAAVVLSSTWQEVSALVASGFNWTTGDYLAMKLTVSSATTPSILLAAPSMIYDASASTGVAGIGVPRVNIVGDAPSPVGRPGLRNFTMTLAEAP